MHTRGKFYSSLGTLPLAGFWMQILGIVASVGRKAAPIDEKS